MTDHDLKCPFCGAGFWVSLRYRGRDDMEADSIECDGVGCYATWEPNGSYVTGGKTND